MNLKDILNKYGVPDPSIVGKLPRGGIQLDFVGHAEITRILLEIDENWSWAPIAWTEQGRPAISEVNGMAVMWGTLTVLGQSRLGVGSARSDKPDLDKELIGDFLRNAAMRFGISLSLWSKSEWEESHTQVAKPAPIVATGNQLATQISRFQDACKNAGIDPDKFALEHVAIKNSVDLTREQLDKLRIAFRAVAATSVKKPEAKPAEVKHSMTGVSVDSLVAKIGALGIAKKYNPQDRLQIATDLIGSPVTNLKDLTLEQLQMVVDVLESARG